MHGCGTGGAGFAAVAEFERAARCIVGRHAQSRGVLLQLRAVRLARRAGRGAAVAVVAAGLAVVVAAVLVQAAAVGVRGVRSGQGEEEHEKQTGAHGVAVRIAGAAMHASGVPRYVCVGDEARRGGRVGGWVAGAPKGMVAGRDPPYAGLTVYGDVEGGPGPALRHEWWVVTRKRLALGDE